MAQNASRVRVALAGRIWAADEGTTVPADIDTPPGVGYTDLGFTNEDGVVFTIGRDTQDIAGWPSRDPLRRLVTAEPKTAAFTLRQLDRETWVNSLGGTLTESGVGTGLWRWEPDEGDIPTKVILVEFEDGDLKYRFGFRRAQNLAAVEFSLVNNDAVNLPNEWSALAVGGGVKSWFMDTDDPAFAAA